MKGDGQEEVAHLARPGEALNLSPDPLSGFGLGKAEGPGAGLEAQGPQEIALRYRTPGLDALPPGGRQHGGKVGVDGQVDLARALERVDPAVPGYGLQGIAEARCPTPVVDQKRRPAFTGDPGTKFGSQGFLGGGMFEDRPIGRHLRRAFKAGSRG